MGFDDEPMDTADESEAGRPVSQDNTSLKRSWMWLPIRQYRHDKDSINDPDHP
jgi:hypothetical protein